MGTPRKAPKRQSPNAASESRDAGLAFADALRVEVRDALRRQDVDLKWLDEILAKQNLDPATEIRFLLRIQEGRGRLEPSRLLRLFDRFPFVEIDEQIALCDFLASESTPTCTLGALRDGLQGLASRLGEHEPPPSGPEPKEEFGGEGGGSRYGQPPGSFDYCPWLGHQVFATYPCWDAQVRVWRGLLSGPKPSDHGRETYDYIWRRPHTTIAELSASDAHRLTDLRSAVLAAKIRILELLARPTPRAEAGALLDQALGVFESAFRAEDLRFLFDVDKRWLAAAGVPKPGGLSDVLTVVGHTECELVHALFDFARVSVEPLVPPRTWDRGDVSRLEYFDLHNDPTTIEWERIDVVLRRLIEGFERHQKAFWKGFVSRVDAGIRRLVGGKSKGLYTPSIETFSDWQEARSGRVARPTAPVRGRTQLAVPSAPRFEAVAWSPSHGVVVTHDFDLREFVKGVLKSHGLTQTAIAERMDRAPRAVSEMLDTRYKDRRGLLFLADFAEAANLRLEIALMPSSPGRHSG